MIEQHIDPERISFTYDSGEKSQQRRRKMSFNFKKPEKSRKKSKKLQKFVKKIKKMKTRPTKFINVEKVEIFQNR